MRVLAFRLAPETDLKAALEDLNRAHAFAAAFVITGVGSLSQARLRMPGAISDSARFRTWSEPLEIVSLGGTFSPEGVHIHISLAGSDGLCVGGHLAQGCIVHTTVELVIGEATEFDFHRAMDSATGYAELTISSRESADSGDPGAGADDARQP